MARPTTRGGMLNGCLRFSDVGHDAGKPCRIPYLVRSKLLWITARSFLAGITFVTLTFSFNAVAVTSPVGATPGSFIVDPQSGAATYSIPIVVPPGTNGMQPQLSLNYNSQGGNGLLGMGWSIGGLSVIHRCGATIAIDGIKGGVNYDANDKFCLDGERLINIGGNEYRTQHESWQKIVASDATTNPASFTVYEKDGTIRYYGYYDATHDARIEAAPPNSNIIRLWMLNRIQDRNGNYLTITYQEDNVNGDYRPDRIDYTGNGSVQPYNSVVFGYVEPQASRLDVAPLYESGSVNKVLKRVTHIYAYAGASLAREYRLTYDNNGAVGRSRLISIQECGSDGVCLPATNLSYQNSASAYAMQTTWSGYGIMWLQSPPGSQLFISGPHFADLNGDGRKDYVTVSAPSSGTATHYVSQSTGSGYTNQPWTGQSHSSIGNYAPYVKFPDLNGDGKSDSVISPTYSDHLVALSSGGSYSNQNWPASPGSFYAFSSDVGDFNGDGRDDLISVVGQSYVVELSNGAGFDHFPAWSDITGVQFVGGIYGDLNGDGRTDYAGSNKTGGYYNALISTGTGFNKQLWLRHPSAPTGSGIIERMADLNGDGKKDMVVIASNGIHYVSLSTGKSYDNQIWTGHPAGDTGTHFFADVNGDGKDDYITVSSNGTHNVSLSTGAGYINQYWSGYGVADTGFATFTDLNGDGQADYVTISSDGIHRVNLSNGAAPDLLVSISNGLGATVTVTYKPLSDSSVHSCVGNTYPYKGLCDATYVVSRYTQSNGIGGVNATSYSYSGMLWHHEAATRIGFATTFAMGTAGQMVTSFNQTLDGTEGTVNTIYTWDSNWYMVKYVSNTWQPISLGAGRTLAWLTASNETNYVLGTTTNTTYSNYDAYGHPGIVTVDFNDGWKKVTTNSYAPDVSNWVLDRLMYSKVEAYAPGQTMQYRESSFEYDPVYPWRLTKEIIEPNRSTLLLTTTYNYDVFGNRWKKTVSGPDITTRDEYVLTFDSFGQFVTTRQNALNHTENLFHDARNGLVINHTDPNGLLTLRSYDGFGRKTYEYQTGGSSTEIFYYTCSDPAVAGSCPAAAVTAVATQSSGMGATWAFYDILGRVVQTNAQGFGGNYTFKETRYDNLGRVDRVSHPYFGGEQVHCTTYGYDTLGRVRTVTEPGLATTDCANTTDSRVTTTSYNGLSTTVTSPPTAANPGGQVKTTVKNSQGLVASVTDAAGTTTYTYDPFANLIRVAKSYDTGADTVMTYDERGRKKTMTDPDMGAWTYQYNALGELISQTDAKGQYMNMGYDKLGRLRYRTTPDSISTWNYDSAVLGTTGRLALGKLAAVYGNNATETYAYNNLSLASSQTTSISGVTYTTSYTYDVYSRPLTLTYPITGFKLYHVYDPYGHLTEVRQDTATGLRYWKADIFDAHSRLTQEALGNGLISTRAYDHATGDLLTIQTGPSGSPTAVQNSSFSFDALDNLTARGWTDGTTMYSETYAYDTLNRLTQVTGPANKTYAYAPNGNLTSKTDVGTYTYPTNGTRPHAVLSIAGTINTGFTYDANGNLLSGNGRTITYTSFNKPKTIAQGSTTSTLTYDAGFNRLIKSNSSGTTIYIGKLYERLTSGSTTTQKHYIYAGPNLVGMYSLANGTPITRYFHTDHLGSVDTITNETGGVVQRLSYDAWGKRRNVNGTDATAITAQTTRGFTRHEHDDEVGLINMNAREYDYVIGRFITPDTLIPGALNSQSYNRYSYVNNNPLSMVDPSGWIHKKIKKAVRSVTRAVTGLVSWQVNAAKSYIDWNVRAVEKAAHNPYVRTAAAIGAGFYLGPLASGLFEGSVFGTSVAVGFTGGYVAGYTLTGDPRVAREAGVTGGVFGGVAYYSQGWSAPGQIGARAVTGGVTTQAQGGDFRTGFIYSGTSATASWGYQKVVGIMATPEAGRGLASEDGRYRPDAETGRPPYGYNVFGNNERLTGNFFGDFFKQGGALSVVANQVPGLNAVAYFHDTWMNQLGSSFNAFTNYSTMPAAAFVGYGALLDGPLSVQLAVDRSK